MGITCMMTSCVSLWEWPPKKKQNKENTEFILLISNGIDWNDHNTCSFWGNVPSPPTSLRADQAKAREEVRDILASAIKNRADDGPSARKAAIRAYKCLHAIVRQHGPISTKKSPFPSPIEKTQPDSFKQKVFHTSACVLRIRLCNHVSPSSSSNPSLLNRPSSTLSIVMGSEPYPPLHPSKQWLRKIR